MKLKVHLSMFVNDWVYVQTYNVEIHNNFVLIFNAW